MITSTNTKVSIHDPSLESGFCIVNLVTYGKEVNQENTEKFTKRVNRHLLARGYEPVSMSLVERIQANKTNIPSNAIYAFCHAVTEDHLGMDQTYAGLMYQVLWNTYSPENREFLLNPHKEKLKEFKKKYKEFMDRKKRAFLPPALYLITDQGAKLEIQLKGTFDEKVLVNFRLEGDRKDKKEEFHINEFKKLLLNGTIRVRAKSSELGIKSSIYGLRSNVKGYGVVTHIVEYIDDKEIALKS